MMQIDHLENGFMKSILDAFPHPVLVVDSDFRINMHNEAASHLMGSDPSRMLLQRSGEALQCMFTHAGESSCGRSSQCKDCELRNSVNLAFKGKKVTRKRAKLKWQKGDRVQELFLLITTSPFYFKGKQFVLMTLEDMSELMELASILPICSGCKKIRDDQDYWGSLEHYFKRHLDVDFSHGLCPECVKTMYPEFSSRVVAKARAAEKNGDEFMEGAS